MLPRPLVHFHSALDSQRHESSVATDMGCFESVVGNSGQNGLNRRKQKGLRIFPKPLRYALEVWQERQDSNLRPAVLELYSACFGLYRPIPENTPPYHATGCDGVRLSQPVLASP